MLRSVSKTSTQCSQTATSTTRSATGHFSFSYICQPWSSDDKTRHPPTQGKHLYKKKSSRLLNMFVCLAWRWYCPNGGGLGEAISPEDHRDAAGREGDRCGRQGAQRGQTGARYEFQMKHRLKKCQRHANFVASAAALCLTVAKVLQHSVSM